MAAVAVWPFREAHISAVLPDWSATFTLAPPAIKATAVAVWPF